MAAVVAWQTTTRRIDHVFGKTFNGDGFQSIDGKFVRRKVKQKRELLWRGWVNDKPSRSWKDA